MKRLLVIARHGTYSDSDGRLNPEGEGEIERLGERIKALIREGEVVKIVTSTAPRASDSTKVLSRVLGGLPYESYEQLWSDDSRSWSTLEAVRVVREKLADADVGIAMTHLEMTENIPPHFVRGGRSVNYVRKGSAWVIDTKEGTLTRIPS